MEQDAFYFETAERSPSSSPAAARAQPSATSQQSREQAFLKEFVITLETLPELWDSSSDAYKNNNLRGEALAVLLSIYRKIKSDATINDVRKKINILRSNYRKELKKILSSKRSGSGADKVYVPKSWLFYSLQFLNRTEQPVTQSSSTVQQSTPLPQESNEERDSEEQNLEAFTSINTAPTPKRKKLGPIARQNELLDKAVTFLSQPTTPTSNNNNTSDNTLHPTALYWSHKLNQLNPTQKVYAEKYINEILFEGALGNLGRNSVQINSFSPDQTISPSTASSIYPVRNNAPAPLHLVRTLTPSPVHHTQSPVYPDRTPTDSSSNSNYIYAPLPSSSFNVVNIPSSTVVSGVPSQLLISRSGHDDNIHTRQTHTHTTNSYTQEDIDAQTHPNNYNNNNANLQDSNYTIGSLFRSFRSN